MENVGTWENFSHRGHLLIIVNHLVLSPKRLKALTTDCHKRLLIMETLINGLLKIKIRLLNITNLMCWVFILCLWSSVIKFLIYSEMRKVWFLIVTLMYLITIRLEGKPLNSVKITGKIRALKCQDLTQKNLINIFVGVWQQGELKLWVQKTALLFILKVKNSKWLML